MDRYGGVTMREALAGLAWLSRGLRAADASGQAERYMLQGEALGFSRAQVWGITDAMMHDHPDATLVQVRELALNLMMSGAIDHVKTEDK